MRIDKEPKSGHLVTQPKTQTNTKQRFVQRKAQQQKKTPLRTLCSRAERGVNRTIPTKQRGLITKHQNHFFSPHPTTKVMSTAVAPSIIDFSSIQIPTEGYACEIFNHPETEILNAAGIGSGLFATGEIEEDNVLFAFVGRPCHIKSRWTVQIGENQHIGVVDGQFGQKWQYMNHCCNPNVQLRATPLKDGIYRIEFVAFRRVYKEDEITFNYLTTELDMDEPFNCVCAAKENCFKNIRGFLHVEDKVQLERLEPFLLPYLKERLKRKPNC